MKLDKWDKFALLFVFLFVFSTYGNAEWVRSKTGGNGTIFNITNNITNNYYYNNSNFNTINISYDNLVIAINAQNLTPNTYYKIIDYTNIYGYVNSYSGTNNLKANKVDLDLNWNLNYSTYGEYLDSLNVYTPIIVRATTNSTLDGIAYPTDGTNHILNYDYNVTNEAQLPQRGWITYRKDPYSGLSADYDYKNIWFKRYKPSYENVLIYGGTGTSLSLYTDAVGNDIYVCIKDDNINAGLTNTEYYRVFYYANPQSDKIGGYTLSEHNQPDVSNLFLMLNYTDYINCPTFVDWNTYVDTGECTDGSWDVEHYRDSHIYSEIRTVPGTVFFHRLARVGNLFLAGNTIFDIRNSVIPYIADSNLFGEINNFFVPGGIDKQFMSHGQYEEFLATHIYNNVWISSDDPDNNYALDVLSKSIFDSVIVLPFQHVTLNSYITNVYFMGTVNDALFNYQIGQSTFTGLISNATINRIISGENINHSIENTIFPEPTIKWNNITEFPLACPTSSFVTQINSSITCTQPSYNDLSGYLYNASGWIYNGSVIRNIDNTKVGIGTSNPLTSLHVSDNKGSNSTTPIRGIMISEHVDSASAGLLMFYRSRGTETLPTSIVNADFVGSLQFFGHDGTSYHRSGQIATYVDGTVSNGTVPMSLLFYTSATNSTGLSIRMAIKPNGNIGIGTTTPSALLHLYKNQTSNSTIYEIQRNEVVDNGAVAVGFGATTTTYLPIAGVSTKIGEIEYNLTSIPAGNERVTTTFRAYTVGALRDVFVLQAQPVFNRYTTGTISTTQAAGTFYLRKTSTTTMSDGAGPRVAFGVEDNNNNALLAGGFGWNYNFTDNSSSATITVRANNADTFAQTDVLKFDKNKGTTFYGGVTYNDTFWDDIATPATSFANGVAAPDLTAWNNTLAEIPCFTGLGITNDYVSGSFEMPHSWKEGSEIEFHLHHAKSTTGAGNYTFRFQYLIMNVSGGYSKFGETNNTYTGAAQWVDTLSDLTPVNVDMTGFVTGTNVIFYLARTQGATNDTYADCVGVKQVSAHFQMDSPGSATEYTKT